MKSILATILAFLAVLVIASLVSAQGDDPKAFYNQGIDHKIAQCEAKASRIDSASSNISRSAQLAEAQAGFFRTHRETLVEQMARQAVAPKEHCVQHFLNKAYSLEVADVEPAP